MRNLLKTNKINKKQNIEEIIQGTINDYNLIKKENKNLKKEFSNFQKLTINKFIELESEIKKMKETIYFLQQNNIKYIEQEKIKNNELNEHLDNLNEIINGNFGNHFGDKENDKK